MIPRAAPTPADRAADGIVHAYSLLRERFDTLTSNAAHHFATRDWHAAHRDASSRLLVFQRVAEVAVASTRHVLGDAFRDAGAWRSMRLAYADRIADRADHEIAATFFNSVSRRVLRTVGVAPGVEFLGDRLDGATCAAPPLLVTSTDAAALERALSQLTLRVPWADVGGAAATVAAALAAAEVHTARVEILATIFYRNKGAYVVARLLHGPRVTPVVLALLHADGGVTVDAVLTTADEVSVVFGFSWSYFQVAVDCPRAVTAFLASIMPLKRVDELYTAIGFHKHGKTELYRGLLDHLRDGRAQFARAPGQPGLVMDVIALPSFNLVVKIIRDTFGYPKNSTRRDVMAHYRFVFLRDRVGRLADAQEFERIDLPRTAFPAALLHQLLAAASAQIQVSDERVVLAHCYTQRHVQPLDVFLRTATPRAACAAIRDYGQALEDLAHAGIFPGDMLLKNFGVSRHGRVIFYDYDEIEDLDDIHFRALPVGDDLDELSADPWFSVGAQDVFPEQFLPFLVPAGPLRDEFLASHRGLLTPEWWSDVQHRLRQGEVFDVYPYARGRGVAL